MFYSRVARGTAKVLLLNHRGYSRGANSIEMLSRGARSAVLGYLSTGLIVRLDSRVTRLR